MTKKIFCIVLALMMVATVFLTGCKDANEDKPESSAIESCDSSEETSIPDSSEEMSDISDESYEDSSEEIITVYYNIKIAEFPFPVTSVEYQLSESMKEKGFLSMEKKDDGSAVYEIKQKDYNEFISQLKASVKGTFDSYNTYFAPYVKSVSYNDDLTEIVITVNKTDYENKSFENGSVYLKINNCITSCRGGVNKYHCFSTGDFTECEIKIVDSMTGDVLETIYSISSILDQLKAEADRLENLFGSQTN